MPKQRLTVTANDSTLRDYYATMQRFADQQVKSEGNVRRAFGQTLSALGRKMDWVLVEELTRKSTREGRVIPDGTLRVEVMPQTKCRWIQRSPAMAAGITYRIWSIRQVLMAVPEPTNSI